MEGNELVAEKIKTIKLLLNEIKNIDFNIEEKDLYHAPINPAYTFKNFLVGNNNLLAKSTAQAIAKNPVHDGKYPSLYIYSAHGLGKTHLLHAIANELAVEHPNLKVCLISSRDFMEEMITLMKTNKINEFVKKYTEKIDVLLIDDIHDLKNKEGTQDHLFHVFNEMHSKGKQLVFTADKRPKEIEGISERIKSRLQWGLVVDILKPDLETCTAILKNLTQLLNFPLKEEILYLIAEATQHNPRELEGAVLRLKSASELMNIEISAEFVKEQLARI